MRQPTIYSSCCMCSYITMMMIIILMMTICYPSLINGFSIQQQSSLRINPRLVTSSSSSQFDMKSLTSSLSASSSSSFDGGTWDILTKKVSSSSSSPKLLPDDPLSFLSDLLSNLPKPPIPQFPDVNSESILLSINNFMNFLYSMDIKTTTSFILSFIQTSWIYYTSLPLGYEILIVLIPIIGIGFTTLLSLSLPDDNYRQNMEPYVRGEYDPNIARIYYQKHPKIVIQRLLQLLRLSNVFIINILLDKYIFRNEDDPKQRTKRANEVLELITKLGPTAIKVGQALSVRPDLIPEEYAKTLSTLQDQVQPFDGKLAQQILQNELGSRYQVIKVSNYQKPIASASIGQVYKGTVKLSSSQSNIDNNINNMNDDEQLLSKLTTNKDGTLDVAVKIQRPNVLAEIALDLYLVREIIAPIYQRITKTSTDLQSLANEWGRGFIAELDYRREAISTLRFNNEMMKRNLNAVCSPIVIQEYSTERMLITEWIDGTRLDESDENDVPRLCSVALNAYLVMLLELKSLHCDPHPGNLLRTKDGRLCILDFGMTLDIDPNLQYSLLEFVAHLTSENYEKLPEDLAALGFLKKDKLEYIRRTGVLEPLKFFLNQAGKGGGAKGVRDRIFEEYRDKYPGLSDDELRIEMRSEMKQQMSEMVAKESVATGITVEVEDLQRRNQDSFQIPEWFLYSSRAFLTLEGVSLAADDNYSLIKSCFPYVAKRLVADDDPRARNALKELLYGASGSLEVNRVTDLADGFTRYTTTTKTINQQANARSGEIVLVNGDIERISKEQDRKNKMIEAEATMTLAKDSADVILALEGNLIQSLLVEESALATSANFKDALRSQLVDGPKLFRESLPFGIGSFLPELPFESRVEPFVRKTEKELKAQQLADKLLSVVQTSANSSGGSSNNVIAAVNNNGNRNPEGIQSVIDTLRGMEPEQAALILKEIRENVPRYAPLVGRLGGKFMSTLLQTASMNIDYTLDELEQHDSNNQENDPFLATVKGLSAAAQRSADAITSSSTTLTRDNAESSSIATLTKRN